MPQFFEDCCRSPKDTLHGNLKAFAYANYLKESVNEAWDGVATEHSKRSAYAPSKPSPHASSRAPAHAPAKTVRAPVASTSRLEAPAETSLASTSRLSPLSSTEVEEIKPLIRARTKGATLAPPEEPSLASYYIAPRFDGPVKPRPVYDNPTLEFFGAMDKEDWSQVRIRLQDVFFIDVQLDLRSHSQLTWTGLGALFAGKGVCAYNWADETPIPGSSSKGKGKGIQGLKLIEVNPLLKSLRSKEAPLRLVHYDPVELRDCKYPVIITRGVFDVNKEPHHGYAMFADGRLVIAYSTPKPPSMFVYPVYFENPQKGMIQEAKRTRAAAAKVKTETRAIALPKAKRKVQSKATISSDEEGSESESKSEPEAPVKRKKMGKSKGMSKAVISGSEEEEDEDEAPVKRKGNGKGKGKGKTKTKGKGKGEKLTLMLMI